MFELVSSNYSNITFNNAVVANDTLDMIAHYYYYNGAGVTIADFDNDGLEDIFLTGNQVPSRLYKNKGNLEFQDITEQAGLLNNSWSTGVTFADVNADGFTDIYVCTVDENEPNLFYLNQGITDGIPKFKEMGTAYGIDIKNISTHAAFFDYDKDDDLDLVVAVNSQIMNYRNEFKPQVTDELLKTSDVLLRNNGDNTFTDVSKEAGVIFEGSSLGLAVNDLNDDGWPDIYIANDFIASDLLYVNNHDGTFTNKTNEYLRHTTYNSMGVDIADVNQDGLMDITVMDMLPESDQRRKLAQMPINLDRYKTRSELGFNPQFVKNTLQINQGTDSKGKQNFSELAMLSGIHATDWSWSPLWADYDNDGKMDLYITNGYDKDVIDLDHMLGIENQTSIGTKEAIKQKRIETQAKVPPIIVNNYLYKNTGNLKMQNISKQSGIDAPSISHGAAFADLDNDGDLELVVNNFRQEMFLYKNNATENSKEGENNNFIKIRLHGIGKNRDGLGAKLKVYTGSKVQNYFHSHVRGYMSSMGETIHFGVGAVNKIDSLAVIWPDNRRQVVQDVAVNKRLNITYQPTKSSHLKEKTPSFSFRNVSDTLNLNYLHEENKYIDFKNDPLLLKMYSKEGPGLAVGDANGDILDDIFIGGASGYNSQIFIQSTEGFSKNVMLKDSIYEDMGALFFDVDNDNDTDLYVVSGGSEFGAASKYYQDRLYINTEGNFEKSANMPIITSSGGPVKGADYDKDGDIDLFVGGKINVGAYPTAPRSYLLNNEEGILEDKTPEVLKHPGMVSDAIWSDFDNDGWVDLILVGEWMEISFYKNNAGKLEAYNNSQLSNSSGWWSSIAGGDFDNDGDIDYLVGNWGTNTFVETSASEPIRLYAGDYDANGKIDPVITYYTENAEGERKEAILHNRDAMIKQIVGFKRRFRDYASYSKASFRQVLTENETKDANVFEAKSFSSSYIENTGDGTFNLKVLPWQCQIAPVNGMLVSDINADGNLDVIMTANLQAAEPIYGTYDASVGISMLGDGKGSFTPIEAKESGIYLDKGQKSIVEAIVKNTPIMVVGVNSGAMDALSNTNEKGSEIVVLKPFDSYAEILLNTGDKMRKEFYYGNSYLSQSSRKLQITAAMKEVIIFDSFGKSRKIK